jgi:hypothetical protein
VNSFIFLKTKPKVDMKSNTSIAEISKHFEETYKKKKTARRTISVIDAFYGQRSSGGLLENKGSSTGLIGNYDSSQPNINQLIYNA